MSTSASKPEAESGSASHWETVYTCEIFATHDDAQAAFEALLATGMAAENAHLLLGHRTRDIREETVGTFAGEIGPDAPVGSFAGQPHERRDIAGSFVEHPESQPKLSFGEAEHEVDVMVHHGKTRSREVSKGALSQVLQPVATDSAHIEFLLDKLRGGSALVVSMRTNVPPLTT